MVRREARGQLAARLPHFFEFNNQKNQEESEQLTNHSEPFATSAPLREILLSSVLSVVFSFFFFPL